MLLVEDDGRRDDGRRDAAERERRLERRIVQRRVGDAVVGDEVLRLVPGGVAHVDAQDGAPAVLVEPLLDAFQVVGLAPARSAPLAPGVQDDDLAVEVVEADGLPRIHEGIALQVADLLPVRLVVGDLRLAAG